VVPVSWQRGFIILIPKSSTADLHDVAEFRPIALLNSEGRLFFTLMEWRLSDYMVSNGYLDSTLQKGFMRDVAGCVEHSETIYRAALDARTCGRDLCVSWIDLANAYGSVKHSLIHFSLEWYHVPDHFCELMWRYYEGLMACVLVGKETTPWFRFGIGVFQGCTVSTILFNAAFNTVFEHLSVIEDDCAYQFRNQKPGKPILQVFVTGYADDLGIVTGRHGENGAFHNNEKALKRLQEWLAWTRSMKAKPKKCIASGLLNGKPVDPELKVWESQGTWYPKFLEDEVFKFLGKGLVADASSTQSKEMILATFEKYAKLIDGTFLTGVEKMWIWEHFAMTKMSWSFLIHDFPPSFVEKELQPIETRYLKKWSGLAKRADPSVLYRSKKNAGMGLKEATVEHKRQRLIRRHQLATSKDPRVRAIHDQFAELQLGRHKQGTNEWKECMEMEKLRAEVKTGKIVGAPSEGAGIGFRGRRRCRPKALDKHKAEREEMLRVFSEIIEQERLVKIMSKPLVASDAHPFEKEGNYFCGWLKWEAAQAVDLSWGRVLQKQDSFLKFVLNSTQDSLPTPSRLKNWAQARASDGKCPLGCGQPGTLMHILCGCVKAHQETPQNRIKWRHDSILLAIYRAVQSRIDESKEIEKDVVTQASQFRSSLGKQFTVPHPEKDCSDRLTPLRGVFEKADDWKVQFDVGVEGELVAERPFPSEIAIVSGRGSRPDGVMWSMKTKTVIWIELTSPWEENMKSQHFAKCEKYNQLATDLRGGKHFGVKWTVLPHYVEIGARGAIQELGWVRMCTQLGITGAARRKLTHSVQDAAIYCSHYIFLCRFHRQWEPQRLIDTWRKDA
jgi:hypothetical protein